MTAHVRVFESKDEVALEAATVFVRSAIDAMNARGRFTVALSGGSAPLPLYRRLGQPPLFDEIGPERWRLTHLFLGDERCVPPSDARNNASAAVATIGEVAELAPLHAVETGEPPSRAAELYDAEVRRVLGKDVFDLVLLGLGTDGHTASLFPESPALEVTDRAVIAVDAPRHVEPRVPRVTFTLDTINAARQVLFIVTGSSKAEIVKRVLGQLSRNVGPLLPAARVRPAGELIWLMDRSAHPA